MSANSLLASCGSDWSALFAALLSRFFIRLEGISKLHSMFSLQLFSSKFSFLEPVFCATSGSFEGVFLGSFFVEFSLPTFGALFTGGIGLGLTAGLDRLAARESLNLDTDLRGDLTMNLCVAGLLIFEIQLLLPIVSVKLSKSSSPFRFEYCLRFSWLEMVGRQKHAGTLFRFQLLDLADLLCKLLRLGTVVDMWV